MLALFALGAMLGLIPAAIAHNKGHGFLRWWLLGTLLWIVAMPLALLEADVRPRCPQCAEVIQAEARLCPHCRSALSEVASVPA